MLNRKCPDCGNAFRRPLRPAGATGAAAYMQFCPHCLRELVFGAGLKVRIILVALLLAAYWGGLFGSADNVTGIALRAIAIAVLAGVWLFMPTFVAGPRRYDEASGMANEIDDKPPRDDGHA